MDTLGRFEVGKAHCINCLPGIDILPPDCVDMIIMDSGGDWFDCLKKCYKVLKPGGAIYALSQSRIDQIEGSVRDMKIAGFEYIDKITNYDLESVYDYWVIGSKGNHEFVKEMDLEMHYKRTSTTRHDAERNWRTFAHMILMSSVSGDIVFDPFVGSGSMGVASYILGRRYIGFEVGCEWVKVANDRMKEYWKEFTI